MSRNARTIFGLLLAGCGLAVMEGVHDSNVSQADTPAASQEYDYSPSTVDEDADNAQYDNWDGDLLPSDDANWAIDDPPPAGVEQDAQQPQDAAPAGINWVTRAECKPDWPTVTVICGENCAPCRKLEALFDEPKLIEQFASFNCIFVLQEDFTGGVPRIVFESPATFGDAGKRRVARGFEISVRNVARLLNLNWHAVHERSVLKRSTYRIRDESTWWSHPDDIRTHVLREHPEIDPDWARSASVAELESAHSDSHERKQSSQSCGNIRWRVFR